jgi:hypothetical protein
VSLAEQSEGFLRAELRYTCEILHTEAVENLSSLQHAFTQTQRAFDGFRRRQKTAWFIGQFVLL